MYELKNGILIHGGKKELAIGQSYYASYHPEKVPVPEGGDRLAEMRKDLKEMKREGFNLCRMASLGDIKRGDDGSVSLSFPLCDAFCALTEEEDMAAMVRLEGYSVNLGNYPDTDMVDENGKVMPFQWSWFVRCCLNHQGILEDNRDATRESARHYASFPSVVSFQIYNEPAYPSKGLYDYHPATIKAYQAFMRQKGVDYPIPHERPDAGKDPAPWISWRLFQQKRMNDFLCDLSLEAKAGYAKAETLTCYLGSPFKYGAAVRGCDYFRCAETMDIVGITHYVPFRGPSFFQSSEILDGAESAAASHGKHAWVIELNARTNIPPMEWERETYATLGRGYKGILYYEWRADYPFPGSPEPEEFGMRFNDRRPTKAYATAIKTIAMMRHLSTLLAEAEKVRSGVAILSSDYANALSDALDNRGCGDVSACHERSITAMTHVYAALAKEGLVPDFMRVKELREGRLPVKVLIVPSPDFLSPEEKEFVSAFAKPVYSYDDLRSCFSLYEKEKSVHLHGIVYDEYDAQNLIGIHHLPVPAVIKGFPSVDARMLRGKEYALVCLTNHDAEERMVSDSVLHLETPWKKATFFKAETEELGSPLSVTGQDVTLPPFLAGGIVLLEGDNDSR